MKYINEGSGSLLACYLRLKICRERNRSEVIRLCEKLRTLEDKEDTLAQGMLAIAYYEMKDEVRALHYGNQVLNVDPYDVVMLKLLIGIHFHRGEHAIVYGYVQRALTRLPNVEVEKVQAIVTRWLVGLSELFRVVPKLGEVLRKMVGFSKEYCDSESEWLGWAEGYKKWYEERFDSGESPTPPWEAWKLN